MLLNLALLGVYSFACLCAGAAILRLLAGREGLRDVPSPAARVATAFLFGSGVLANVWLLIALLPGGALTPWVIAGVLAVCLLVGIRPGWREATGFARQLGRAVRRWVLQEPWAWKIVGLASLVLLGLYGLESVLPPKGDAAAFYAVLPKMMTYTHRLLPLPGFERFTQIGLHGEMHFAALMGLGGEAAATMFVFAVTAGMIVMLMELARRAGLESRGRWIVLTMAVTSLAVTKVIPGGKVDLFGSAMAIAAIYWALGAAGCRPGLALGLAGIFCGFAVVAKMSLLATAVPMVGLLALWRTAMRPGANLARTFARLSACCLLLLGAGLLAAAPHLLKNGLLFGDPLAPFSDLARGNSWLQQEWLSPAQAKHLLCIYPLALFLGQFDGMHGPMSVLVLAFFPLLIVLPWPGWGRFVRSPLVQLTVVAILAVAIWAVGQTSVFSLRYFLPPLLVLFLPAARGAQCACRVARPLHVGVLICLFLTLAATFNRPKGHPGRALGYAMGYYDEVEVGDFPARLARPINRRIAPGERVFLATPYSYFLRPDVLADLSGEGDFAALSNVADPQQRWAVLFDRGFRYLLLGPQWSEIHADGTFLIGRQGVQLNSAELPSVLALRRLDKSPGPFAAYELTVVAGPDSHWP